MWHVQSDMFVSTIVTALDICPSLSGVEHTLTLHSVSVQSARLRVLRWWKAGTANSYVRGKGFGTLALVK